MSASDRKSFFLIQKCLDIYARKQDTNTNYENHIFAVVYIFILWACMHCFRLDIFNKRLILALQQITDISLYDQNDCYW